MSGVERNVSYEELMACARRGAELLDKEIPYWYTRINTQQLSIKCDYRCVLAQLFEGSYSCGCLKLGIDKQKAVEYGFTTYTLDEKTTEASFQFLTTVWKRLINDRLLQNAA